MVKKEIPIKGMHCRSCELLIEENLEKLPGVEHARASQFKRRVVVTSDEPLDMKQVRRAVKEAGYSVGDDRPAAWLSRDPRVYRDLALSALAVLALYLIARSLGIFHLGVDSENPSNLPVVLLIGLVAGFSTCMALVGGLVLGISARYSEKHPEATRLQRFRPHLFFNLGRITSFLFFGGLIGLSGKVFHLSGTLLGVMIMVVGGLMLFLGIQLTEVFPRMSSGGLTLPKGLARFLRIRERDGREYGHANAAILGAVTFFLPCGFTQAMQLYAMSTGNFFSGALIMGAFALGTTPGLLGVGGLASFFKGAGAKRFYKFAGVLVVALALFNISNGYHLTGWTFFSANAGAAQVSQAVPAETAEGYQVVNMTQNATGYQPNRFTVKVGVPVKWDINSVSASCATSLQVPGLGITKSLKRGENSIEFTPTETGTINFSCGMGMYTGQFYVTDGDPASAVAPTDQAPPAAAPGSC